MSSASRALIAVALGALLAAGCTTSGVGGRPRVGLVSKEQERQMGREEAQNVRQTLGLVEDPELTAYLDAIGQRLVAELERSDFDYSFHIVDLAEPNAFALPGGYVYVSRGLLALTNSEDELAAVLGHEIGHVGARHAGQRLTLAAPFALVTGIGSFATGIVSPALGQIVGGVGQLAGGAVLAPYSRKQEREADRLGIRLAARAGWDPYAMSRFLQTLERDEELHQGAENRWSFFASHPTTPERVANTAAMAKTVERGQAAPLSADRRAFLERFDGLLVGPDPAVGLFVDERFVHPELLFSIRFPTGWRTENARAYVGAAVPGGNAACFLTVVARGNDPLDADRARALAADAARSVERGHIGDLPYARLRTRVQADGRTLALNATWIACDGLVYQLAGVTTPTRIASYDPVFVDWAKSFRPLTTAERDSLTEARLRIETARPGEFVEALTARTGTPWSAREVEVANQIESGTSLGAGEPVKVAVREPYRPRGAGVR